MSSQQLPNDVAVKYTNKTRKTDFKVVVYATNETSEDHPLSLAYRVLDAQTSVQFVYTKSVTISATYRKDGQYMTAGPIPALHGNKYQIIKEQESDAATIQEAPLPYTRNSGGAITIQNVKPKSWSGQLFDVVLSAGDSPLLVQSDVYSGNTAVFMSFPILRFGIARNVQIGKAFSSLELSSDEYKVDLRKYPNGVEVILKEDPGGEAYIFTAAPLTSSFYY